MSESELNKMREELMVVKRLIEQTQPLFYENPGRYRAHLVSLLEEYHGLSYRIKAFEEMGG